MKRYPILAVSSPILVAVIVSAIIGNLDIASVSIPRLDFLLNTIITTSATISGFILASVTILVSSASSPIMKEIREKGGLQELRWRYTESLILGFVVIVFFSVLGAVIEADINVIELHMAAIAAGILIAYLCSIVSTCYYLLSIIGKLYNEAPVSSDVPSSPQGPFRLGTEE